MSRPVHAIDCDLDEDCSCEVAREMHEMVEESFFGPKCTVCKRGRTLNPTGICSTCLGDHACPKCEGLGFYRSAWAPRACGRCEGTGVQGGSR